MDSAELTKRIGERLRETRKLLGWSLSDLSARTGGVLKKSRLSNYEQGLRRPGIEEVFLLAKVFGMVSPTWVLCLDESTGPLNAPEIDLLARYRAADARGRDLIQSAAEIATDVQLDTSRRVVP
ncbi:hypothetical protein CKO23_16690 [Thiocystis violacea]|nr:hypothetical protein [Thiocystis violacea]